ncbi:MAG TPA: glycoside hydrolase family 78 protein [Candidatus Parabacteroides intestinavium]|nr:glycoside hydrolase family 78 protein [Candidatus Parabacteroides intestinavium]
MKRHIILCGLCLALAGLTGCNPPVDSVEVTRLQVEMKSNPLGIDVAQPRFSWQIASDKPDLMQVGYRIQVAASPEDLQSGKNLLWDSGEITSDCSLFIPYEGEMLQSRQSYYWRVKVKTNQSAGDWSEVQMWSMAILNPTEWKARWIGENQMSNPGETDKDHTRLAARYLRKPFSINKEVKRATLYISGLGSSESYLNGKRISEDIFAPMPSHYPTRVYYNVYDVTDLLQQGDNLLGVVLGNGRYFAMRNPGMLTYGLPSLLAQLEMEYTDGTTEQVVSDTSWKVTSQGPIIANNEFDGEEYDARKDLKGWNTAQYDDSAWKTAELMDEPQGKLVAQPNPNLTIQDTVKPIQVIARSDGKYILDMGQNMVGWLNVQLKGKAGKPITLKFAEILNPDTTLYLANLRSAKVTDVYTPASDAAFTWEPSFVYHGFRYVEVDGLDYRPEPSDFSGYVIYDEMSTTGKFKSSNPLVDQIHKNAYWGIRGNYRGMPTDCPQRDERLGWLGDRVTGASGEAYLFNNALLYNKWLQDIEDSMSPEGSISDVSPKYWTIYNDDVTWPAAFFTVAEMLHRQFGDDSAIRRHYPAMKKWMQHMEQTAMQDYIITKDTYGDWCMPPEEQHLIHSQDPARKTDGSILGTSVYYNLLHLMMKFADICGKSEDIAGYQQLADKMKEAYNKKFFNPETAQYGNNTVTANMLSLRLGLVPEGYEQKVFDNIVQKTEVDFKGHVSTGVLGIQHLMRGLTEYGRKDLAYKILTNEDYPSWGYMINKGATTIWELWNGDTADPAMNSANHVMLLGDLLIWYYEDLAGIKCADDAVAFKKIEMSPVLPEGLDYVDASYESAYGTIESEWTRDGDKLTWRVVVPGNTSAQVYFPEGYQKASNSDLGNVRYSDDKKVEVGSGEYIFHFTRE